MSRQGNSPLGPRTSHGSVFDEVQDALFIYGGFDLNKVRGDFLKYEFKVSNLFELTKMQFKLIFICINFRHLNGAFSTSNWQNS